MRKKVMSLLIALALVLGSAATVTNGFAEIGGGGVVRPPRRRASSKRPAELSP